jgi:serine/threonine-protein kinase
MVRRRDELHAKQIPGTENAGAPFFAPDGKRLGFFQGATKLMIVGFDGNPPVFVTDSLIGIAGAAWAGNDIIYVDGVGQTPIVRVEARAGAKPKWLTALDTAAGERDEILPSVLPNDKGILFTAELRPRDGNPIHHAIEIADPQTGAHHVLIDHAVLCRYAAPGYLVYVTTTRAAMAVPFDLSAQKITGTPVLLAEDLSVEFNALDLAVSQTGTLLYTAGGRPATGRNMVWVARDGHETPLDSAWHGAFSDPVISPDGKLLAVTSGISLPDVNTAQASNIFSAAGAGDIWVRRLADGVVTKLSLEGGTTRFPAWSGNSKSVLYAGGVNAQTVMEKQVDAGTPPVPRAEAEQYLGAVAESPDGQWLLYQQGTGISNAHLFARRRGDSVSVSLFKGPAVTRGPAFSPDGKWLAYTSNETGTNEVFVVPFPNVSSAKWQVSRAGGNDPHWSNHGDELIYRDTDRFLVSVPVSTKPAFSSGTPRRLFSTTPYLARFTLEHDDLRFLMVRSAGADAHERLSVYENWVAKARQK